VSFDNMDQYLVGSMAMTQEPIDWRYLPYIRSMMVYVRAKFQGIYPQNMVLYGTAPPF